MNYQDHVDHCPFCTPDASHILWSGDRLNVILPRGPLLPGHLLIVTTNHLPSFRGAPSHLRAQLFSLRTVLHEAVLHVYGEASLFFEHGVGAKHSHEAETHCTHAHQNLVPSPLAGPGLAKVVAKLRSSGLEPIRMPEPELQAWYAEDNPDDYYYLSDHATHYRFDYGTTAPGPRFFRRHLGELSGLSPAQAAAWDTAAMPTTDNPLTARLRRILRPLILESS